MGRRPVVITTHREIINGLIFVANSGSIGSTPACGPRHPSSDPMKDAFLMVFNLRLLMFGLGY